MSSLPKERALDQEELIRTALDEFKSSFWTGAPGVVESYDPKKQTASVRLTIKSVQRMPDGSTKHVSIPVLQDVPVQFPGAGGALMTFPVKKGDECFVHFSSRSPDSWQQSGGEQAPVDAGGNNLSCGFASLGFRSNPEAAKVDGGSDPDAVQIRSNDGKGSVSLKPGGAITMKNDSQSFTMNAGGMQMEGTLEVTGDIILNGISLKSHKHTGVTPGGSNTGGPTS